MQNTYEFQIDYVLEAEKMAHAIQKNRTEKEQAVWFAHHRQDIAELFFQLADHIEEIT